MLFGELTIGQIFYFTEETSSKAPEVFKVYTGMNELRKKIGLTHYIIITSDQILSRELSYYSPNIKDYNVEPIKALGERY